MFRFKEVPYNIAVRVVRIKNMDRYRVQICYDYFQIFRFLNTWSDLSAYSRNGYRIDYYGSVEEAQFAAMEQYNRLVSNAKADAERKALMKGKKKVVWEHP